MIIEFGFMVWHMKLQRQDLYTTQFAEEKAIYLMSLVLTKIVSQLTYVNKFISPHAIIVKDGSP